MLIDVLLLEAYRGVNAGQCTQLPQDIAESLIEKGIAKKVEQVKQVKSETKKVGK
jgi:hypothetical protein